jgi:hypothetical protein
MDDVNAVALDKKPTTSQTNVAMSEANVAAFDINLIGRSGERRIPRHECDYIRPERGSL